MRPNWASCLTSVSDAPLQLRLSIDQLKPGPCLGGKFAAVGANQDLEELAKSIPPSYELSADNVVSDDDLKWGTNSVVSC